MTRNLILTGLLLVAIAIASGCSSQPTDVQFGDAVRNVMEYQIHDYEAALHPPPDAIEGSDPERLNAVIEVHRNDAQEAPQPINISIGGL